MGDPGMEKFGDVGYTVFKGKRHLLKKIQQLKVTEKDIWVVTYPRSGTTWTQEMIWAILNGLKFEEARKIDIDKKFYFLDFDWLRDGTDNIGACQAAIGQQRLIKTHQPLTLLPKDILTKCKVIYVARNPKDVVVSYYHHHRLTKSIDPNMEFKDFVKLFTKELLIQGPYLANVREGLANQDKLLLLWYEEMKRDLPQAIRRVSQYLGKSVEESEVSQLAEYLHFDSMKTNPAVNH